MIEKSKPTILIIDDAPVIRRTAAIFLDEKDYNVISVEDGFNALAAINDVNPDIIFLDVLMPKLDGYQVCTILRSNPQYQSVPIIMLSSKDSPFDMARGKMLGCTDYLTKPFKKETIIACIDKYLK